MTTNTLCPKCSAKTIVDANFCAECGAQLRKAAEKLRTPLVFTVATVLLAATLSVMAWNMQAGLAGEKPKPTFDSGNIGNFQQAHNFQQGTNDPIIDKLWDSAKADSNNVGVWWMLFTAIYQKQEILAAGDPQRSAFALQMVDALNNVLRLEPKNTDALLAMAQVAFEQQAFVKANDYYERYLEVNPLDLKIKAQYASSLAFTGNLEKSKELLKSILEIDPNNFQALAYLSITLAQGGELKESREFGDKALVQAPSQEAKERLQKFLSHLQTNDVSTTTNPSINPPSEDSTGKVIDQIVGIVKGNQIAGQKFVSHEVQGESTLVIMMKDFPMAAMPPFAKEKFLSPIKALLGQGKLTTIKFIDLSSKEVLEEVKK